MAKTKILIVEDEGIISQSLEYLLREMGYEVTETVTSGEEAIRSVSQNPPDLVLMDIQLGTEMDGVEATKIIKQSENAPPIIYLTAYSDEQTINRAKITTPFAFITKPFESRELQICIEVALYNNKIEKELRNIKSRLNAVIKSIADGLITALPDGSIDSVNVVAEKILNVDKQELIGKNIFETIHIHSAPKWNKSSELNIKDIPLGSISLQLGTDHFITISGKKTMHLKSGTITKIVDEQGKPAGILLIFK